MSGIVLEIKRLINSSKWNTTWISLFAEAFGWYIIEISFGRARKHNFDTVFFVNHILFKMLFWKHPIHNIQFRFSLVCNSNFLKLFMYLYFLVLLFCSLLNTAYVNVLSKKFSFEVALLLSAKFSLKIFTPIF